ncbi:hypothetical protein M408DRAFT_330317 [Serendipita vermifera MAFF 305830]|uniref:Uncharacterized protein n=1 Tax=Serendipita vermifera MAFF 305830 TaxID=933852 RepID=A0A0C3AQY3_SERVB|nr:hypothetical protein M408DRAFT_330317 [Serendipita vermifera MAFF 305830]
MAEELKVPMENCPDLQSLCVAFDGSFSKLLSSSLPMSSAIFLETFAVFIPPEHMPTLPPSPATTHRAVSRSPSASPLQHTRRLSMSVGASTDLTNEEKLGSTRVSATVSESGIHLREIRKFVRRSPALREVTWYGRNGIQGKWSVSRSFAGTQSSVNQSVEYIYCPALSEDVYDRFQREENASRAGWSPGTVEREEANWTGPNAELYRSLRAAEKDNEEKQAREEKAARLSSRKGGLGIEMPKQPPKTNNSPSLDGPPAQFPSPVSPVEPKPILSPNHSTRERRHTSASLGSRSNGERVQSDDMAPQQYKPRDQLETSRSKGYRGSSRGRGFDKRGAHTGSEGRPRAVSNGTIMSKKEPESASASNRGGNARGGRFIRGTRGTGSRSRRAEY